MLKKLPLLMFALVFLMGIGQSYAQEGTITGTVIDSTTSETLPGASILIEDLGTGATTDSEGNYTIENVPVGTYMVTASFVGYDRKAVEVEVTEGSNMVNFSIVPSTYGMDNVVVTAYGIEQQMNELPYSAQSVQGETISDSRNDNFMESLSGRVAGLKVSNMNGMGGSTNIIMRGYKSITGNNQPLFVVDGVPYANQEFNDADQESGFAGYDYGNTAVDINSNNIESINVLKGPAAAALYGSRAANGAIVIETKKGMKGQENTNITFNSSVQMRQVNENTFPDHQMQYGAGYAFPAPSFSSADINGDGTPETLANLGADASYGPRFDSETDVYQWDALDPGNPNFMTATSWTAPENKPIEFFDTGTNVQNSLTINGGFEDGYYKFGYNQTNTKGIMPNSELDKYKLNFSSGYNVTDRLEVSGSINYSRQEAMGRQETGYSTIMSMFRQWWATNVDITRLQDAYERNQNNPYSDNASWNLSPDLSEPYYWNNPYFERNENYTTDQRDRYFGYAEANYDVADWLNITGRVSVDTYSQIIEERVNLDNKATQVPNYTQQRQNFAEHNYDLLANYNLQPLESLEVSGVVGMNIRRSETRGITATTNGGLATKDLFSLSNSVYGLQYPSETDITRGVNGYFARVALNYNDYLNIELTGRRDKSSTLPEDENVYYYPSASAGFIFSEFVDAEWLSFGKLRASAAEVGSPAPAYSLNDTYMRRDANFGAAPLYTRSSIKNNPDLKPERTRSWEVGLQMAFLNEQLRFDANYYDQNTLDQIIATDVSRASGYAQRFINAGNVENRGVEITATAKPVANKNFQWTITANWNKNVNEVKELAEGVQNYQLASPQGGVSISAALGEAYGAIRGTDFVRHDNGGKLVGSDGYYEVTPSSNNIIGNMNPDWTGGISNELNYQNWTFNALVDVSWGGDIFSLDQYYGQYTGLYPRTAGDNARGNPKRAPTSEGGGVLFDGVNADGSQNDNYAPAQYYAGAFLVSNNPHARYVYDASYVKLREVGITYGLPADFITKTGVLKAASISVIGRNLWIIHKNLPHSDPEQSIGIGNVRGYQGGAQPTTRNFTFNLELKF